jgi:CarD family transcriptional regulator
MKKPASKSKKTNNTKHVKKLVKKIVKKVVHKPLKKDKPAELAEKKKPELKKPEVKEVKQVIKTYPKTDLGRYTGEKINFKVGDSAVYPAHGVGRIEARESKTIMGEIKDFFIINILDTGMKVLVPVDNIQTVGLRKVIPASKVQEVIDILSEKKRTVISHTWNRRYREYMEKIKSGSVFEIAHVLRDLFILKTEKDLSFGERKMLDTARSLLVKELAIAKNINEKIIDEELNKIFSEIVAK